MGLFKLLKKTCTKWLSTDTDEVLRQLKFTEEIEAAICFEQVNKIYRKAHRLGKSKIDYTFPDDMSDYLQASFQTLIEEYIDMYKSLPMYATEFVLPDPEDSEKTVSAVIDYIYPPEYNYSFTLFLIEVNWTKNSEEERNEDDTIMLPAF